MTAALSHPALRLLDAQSEPPPDGLPSLLGATSEELQSWAQSAGQPAYRGRQLFAGLFRRRITDFAQLTDLPKALRAELRARFDLARPRIDMVQAAGDGTRKYRFVGKDGRAFEAVYIPEVARGAKTNTLCVSSQTGCAVGCKFCFTASLRRNRNLAAAEIVGQVLAVQHDVTGLGEGTRVTNIVFMGMGEPLLNYPEVVKAARILVHPDGPGFSTRRVTISTAGIVPRIYDLGRDLPTQLAVSLNATTDAVRNRIMPINKKWPLADLLAALRAYPLAKRRRITIEYVLLQGVNDSPADARRLPQLLAGIPVKVNLLPLNPHDRTDLAPPPWEQVLHFQSILHRAGLSAIVRTPRGQEIAAACGQLGDAAVAPPAAHAGC